MTTIVASEDFAENVLRSEVPVLVSFRAKWCRQSLELAPIVEEVAKVNESRVKVVAVDVGDDIMADKVCRQFRVNRLPVTMLFNNGRVVDFIGGPTTGDNLGQMISKELKPIRDVTDRDFEVEVLRSRIPVLLHVDAISCGASVALGDLVEEVALRYRDRVKTVRLDFEGDTSQVRARYGWTRTPILAMFQGGELVDQIFGGLSEAGRFDEERLRLERMSKLENIAEMVGQFAL